MNETPMTKNASLKGNQMRQRSACDQARAIAAGEISSQALLTAQAKAIDELNPQINAYVQRTATTDFDSLETQKTEKTVSALAGTSFAVKDNIDVAGLASHCGLKALNAQTATRDAPVVARLRGAGLVFTGKLNMAPMAMGASTHNPDFGHCYNPVRKGFSAGGSSGGAASAVAAGLVSIALGTDTMGSVRLPAAYCGIVGFKPTWGHIPTEGVMPLSRALDHVGVLARSVEDADNAYRILSAHEPAQSIANSDNNDDQPPVLAIAKDPGNLGLEPAVMNAYLAGLESVRAAGMRLVPIDFSAYSFTRVRRAGLLLSEAELQDTLREVYPARREQLSPTLAGMMDFVAKKHAVDLARALALLMESRHWLEQQLQGVDFLLLPTAAHCAFDMKQDEPADSADLTAIANVLGAPSISLPLPLDAAALPVGLQLVGHRHADFKLLAFAAKLAQQLTR